MIVSPSFLFVTFYLDLFFYIICIVLISKSVGFFHNIIWFKKLLLFFNQSPVNNESLRLLLVTKVIYNLLSDPPIWLIITHNIILAIIDRIWTKFKSWRSFVCILHWVTWEVWVFHILVNIYIRDHLTKANGVL